MTKQKQKRIKPIKAWAIVVGGILCKDGDYVVAFTKRKDAINKLDWIQEFNGYVRRYHKIIPVGITPIYKSKKK